jgi:putative solute:sodium symporter small subunit
VTADETEIENAARDRHQLRTLSVAITAISVVFCGTTAVLIYAIALNRLSFLHYPLGFYLLAQGLLILAVVVVFWYVRIQERIDHTRSLNEEIT